MKYLSLLQEESSFQGVHKESVPFVNQGQPLSQRRGQIPRTYFNLDHRHIAEGFVVGRDDSEFHLISRGDDVGPDQFGEVAVIRHRGVNQRRERRSAELHRLPVIGPEIA